TLTAILAAILIGLLFIGPSTGQAQNSTITYGSTVTGTLAADQPFFIYQFNGLTDDLISAYVVGLDPNMAPSLSLLGPSQQQLAVAANDIFGSEAGVARLGFKLPQDGFYSLLVASANGSPGAFALRLDKSSAVFGGEIPPNTPVGLDIPPNAFPTRLLFAADPVKPTCLTVRSKTPGFAFLAQLYDPSGFMMGAMTGPTLTTLMTTLAAGNGQYAVVIQSLNPATQGTVEVLVGTCDGGEAVPPPVVPIVTATLAPPTVPPPPLASPTPLTCRVTSTVNVNVRSGPGVIYPTIGSLFAGTYMEVTGANRDGSWFVVDMNGRQGWVSSGVALEEGPCANLPYIYPPPTPTFTPTYTPTPTFTPAWTATPPPPMVMFTVNGTGVVTINQGECVLNEWYTANVQAVYYEDEGIAGVGNRQECPNSTRTYTLRVRFPDGQEREYTVGVNVNP
ncbi:SH3 domain-containing protein, partial [Chloroflexota bacterium]